MGSSALDNIPIVDIDQGRFKYILIRVYSEDPVTQQESSKVIVRGYLRAAFHGDIYDEVQDHLRPLGLDTECLGGGRIEHEPAKKSIHVYGYSQGFGLADHSLAVDLLKDHFADYTSITWANEGY